MERTVLRGAVPVGLFYTRPAISTTELEAEVAYVSQYMDAADAASRRCILVAKDRLALRQAYAAGLLQVPATSLSASLSCGLQHTRVHR